MNFHSDEWIMKRVREHYDEALKYFEEDRIIGIFYHGSGNYGMDYECSDVDTKLVVAPTFRELALGETGISTTHIRDNDEHIDFKDIRLYLNIFRRQNMNFLEILFTKYCIINPIYQHWWNILQNSRENIVRYAPVRAVKAMQGVAKEKYFAMEHQYPSRMEWIEKFSYDPKQLHHLFRVEEFIERYINGEPYDACLIPKSPDYLVEVKKGCYTLGDARWMGKVAIEHVDEMCKKFISTHEDTTDSIIDEYLDMVQLEIIKIAARKDIEQWKVK